MTVETTNRISGPFAGSGAAADLAFGFKVFEAADVRVVRVDPSGEIELTDGIDYTVVLNADQNVSPGGTVSITAAAFTSGRSVYITSDVAAVQKTKIPQRAPFLSSVIEQAFDRLTILMQQLLSTTSRAIVSPIGEAPLVFPPAADRAGKFLSFGAAGEIIASPGTGTDTTLRTDLAASSGSTLVKFIRAGSGAVARTVQALLRDVLAEAPEDFGAVGDGVADDTLPLLRLFSTAGSKRLLPGKTYAVRQSIPVLSNTTVFAQGATLKAVAPWVWGAGDTDPSYGMFDLRNASNVMIFGGTVDGNKSALPTRRIFGVVLYNATDVLIDSVTAKNCPSDNSTNGLQGDGFYIDGNSKRWELRNCHADGNVRQGCSVIYADGGVIRGGSYRNTSGNNPGAGIDLESDNATHKIRNVRVEGALLEGNYRGIQVSIGADCVVLEGNVYRHNRAEDIYIAGSGLGDPAQWASGVSVVGGVVESSPTVDGSAQVFLRNVEDINVVGLLIRSAQGTQGRAGILLYDYVSNCRIASNVIKKSTGPAVQIGAANSYGNNRSIDIEGNTTVDCVRAGSSSAVVEFYANSLAPDTYYAEHVSARDNRFHDTRAGADVADYVFAYPNLSNARLATFRIADNFKHGVANWTSGFPHSPLWGKHTFDPGALAAGARYTSPDIGIAGAEVGDAVIVYPGVPTAGHIVEARVRAPGTVNVDIQNISGAPSALGSGTWRYQVVKAQV